jgi:tetratricopeptide (TPR) repeat protein
MPSCAHCLNIMDVSGGEKSKSCAKCRDVTYCGVDCQKADWRTHKPNCKPCERYVVETVATLHDSDQWRKLLKWRPSIDVMLANMRDTDDLHRFRDQYNTQTIGLLHALVEAYKLGMSSTGDVDHVYALAALPLLDEMAELMGKMGDFEFQGLCFCDLAHLKTCILGCVNNDIAAYYEKASDLAARHFIPSVQARACFGLGRAANGNKEYEKAATLLRKAIHPEAQTNPEDAVHCVFQLIDVLIKLNLVDEIDTFIQRCPRLIQEAVGPDFEGIDPMHLAYHLVCAQVHEAHGKTTEAARELSKLITLVHENKPSIHDWRPLLLEIIYKAKQKLKILDPKTGNKVLVKSIQELARTQRMPNNYMQDGVLCREIILDR